METFFGPWRLRASVEPSQFFERFIIAGSDAADGIFEPVEDGPPIELEVSGGEWTIDFQARFQEGDWFPYEPVRATRFVPQQGLTVWLTGETIAEPDTSIFAHLLVVRCISKDPTLSPPMIPNPFDFSLPKG